MKETASTSQIPGVLEPVWCSNASRRGLPVSPDSPTPAPSSEAGSTAPDTDKGEAGIAKNFTCVVDGMEGEIDKAVDDGDASHPRSAPQPGGSISDTATGSEAGTEPGHTQAGVGKGGGVTRGKGGVVENISPLTVRGCKHDRKGYCSTNEMVAIKKYREIPCLKAGRVERM